MYNVFSGSVAYERICAWKVQDQPRVDGDGQPEKSLCRPEKSVSSPAVTESGSASEPLPP
jgi:hypothetical protein